jgi:peroxiredoxin
MDASIPPSRGSPLANDVAWWIPFGLVLRHVYSEFLREGHRERLEFDLALNNALTQEGDTIGELTEGRCVLLVFLRHAGCTFCREALAELSKRRSEIEASGAHLAFVHMSAEERAAEFFARYGMEDLPRVSDRDRFLYAAFDLRRGRLFQLFGFKVWWRGFVANVVNGNHQGAIEGDGFQMPGVFLLRDGQILASFRHRTAADRPDYLRLAKCDACAPAASATA